MDFSICGTLGQFCGASQTRFLKKRVSASFTGVENEAFPIKDLAFKVFVFILCKIRHFCPKKKNSYFIILLMSGLYCIRVHKTKYS